MIKNLTLSVGLLLSILSASAQSIQFGVKGGLNTSSFARSGNADYNSTGSNTLVGFQGGLFANLNLGNLSIQPAIIYTGKGGRTYMDYIDDDIRDIIYGKASIYYLQIPVNLIYHVPLTNGKLFVGAGPFVSRAINGRFNAYEKPANADVAAYYRDRYASDIEFNSNKVNGFKSFDYGINGLIGVQLNKVLLNVNYDLGLANINPERRSSYKTRTRSAGLTMGYIF
jgi:hypothetical protein